MLQRIQTSLAIFLHLQTLSSSRNVERIYAHSLLITARSSAAVLAALICLIKSLKRIGVGVRTLSRASVITSLITAMLKAGLNP
uniref:Putative secreted protein n=1 Tax=Panstrongylus lignarius TaxID=156445 RepID=A0A224XSF4_9HEMI